MKFKKRWIKLGWPFAVLFLLCIIVMKERIGLKTTENESGDSRYERSIGEVGEEEFSPRTKPVTEALLLYNAEEESSMIFREAMTYVLDTMRIGYEEYDIGKGKLPPLENYDKVVLTVSELSALGEQVVALSDWVKQGGSLMNTATYNPDGYFQVIADKMGILNTSGINYADVDGMRVQNDAMLGVKEYEYRYEESYATALDVYLSPDAKVCVESLAKRVPLMWETEYGEGKFVVMNQALTGKVNRGILSAAYSMLGRGCVYPVINGSAFYIDDFPSPVPEGDSDYITKQYGISISNFYSNIWWPDMMELADQYGIRHTGGIIEEYSDTVKPPFEHNLTEERFLFFGNMLLNRDGELGFHGYNHMPLCTQSYDYQGKYDGYKKWPSAKEIEEGLAELQNFSTGLFPQEKFQVYIPPSNILSEEGRSVLTKSYPDIKVISSTYFPDELAYHQEFEVASDGMVEAPRITAGCNMDDFMYLAAFSELNFHYVQSHFLHPDDVLDADRGAALGWETLKKQLGGYMDYIYTSAPDIRNLTGSRMGEAVREFDRLTVNYSVGEDQAVIELGGFAQEAYLMCRINEGEPQDMTGGTYEHLTGDLYLIHAVESRIEIGLQ